MVHVHLSRAFVCACALGVLAAACDGGGAPTRGFGSRQLVATRDPTFGLSGQLDDHTLLASTQSGPDGGQASYVSIDIATGQVTELGTSVPVSPPPAPDGGVARFTCVRGETSGRPSLIVTDTQTGQSTSLDFTFEEPACPSTEGQVIRLWRQDDAGAFTLWVGPYDQLVRVAPDLVIHRLGSLEPGPSVTVRAARTSAPDALGIFAIDLTTTAITELLAPALGAAAIADGAPPGIALDSATLSDAFPVFEEGDHFIYARVLAGGGTAVFAGPMTSGPVRELALFPTSVPPRFVDGPFGKPLRLSVVESGATGDIVRIWDDVERTVVSCDLPSTSESLLETPTRDGGRLLFGVQPVQDGPPVTGPLLLVSLDLAASGTACSALAAKDVAASGFSADDTTLYWTTAPADGDATLWSARDDGSAARQLGAAPSIGEAHALAGTQIELKLGADLVWLDLAEAEPSLHYIAERVFGDVADVSAARGGRSLIAGYDFNPQDGSGTLGVVDRVTGAKRLISPAVISYRVVTTSSLGAGASTFLIAYVVRGRHPSAQDGLWVATFSPGDLP